MVVNTWLADFIILARCLLSSTFSELVTRCYFLLHHLFPHPFSHLLFSPLNLDRAPCAPDTLRPHPTPILDSHDPILAVSTRQADVQDAGRHVFSFALRGERHRQPGLSHQVPVLEIKSAVSGKRLRPLVFRLSRADIVHQGPIAAISAPKASSAECIAATILLLAHRIQLR